MDSREVRGRTFHGWLSHQLVRRDWTQADFARKLGTTNGVVSRWARGDRVPSPESIDRIADVLGVGVDYVLALAGHRPALFDIDPNSPEAQLLPLIRQIDWASRPGRLEEMQAELRFMIETDRRQRKGVTPKHQNSITSSA